MFYTIYYKGNTYHVTGERAKKAKIEEIEEKTGWMLCRKELTISEDEKDIYLYRYATSEEQKFEKNGDFARRHLQIEQHKIEKLLKLQSFTFEEWKEMVRQKAELEKELFFHNMAERWTDKERAEVHHKEYALRVLRELL